MNFRYVVIEGPIGVGKTFLAKKLASLWGMAPLLEDTEANPFLSRFFQNRRQYAFATQISFLSQRGDYARELLNYNGFETPQIADFMFDRDSLWSDLILDPDELLLYSRLRPLLLPEYPLPDLVIYLQASPSVLAERIARRNLPEQHDFPEGLLTDLVERYHRFFHRYDAAPVMSINTDQLDLVDSQADLELVLDWIKEMRGQRSHFNPSF